MTKELTEGKALPLLLQFSIPLFLGGILQQLYQITDSAIVSNFLGVNQLAAVGASSSVMFLILGFCNGCGGGMAIPVAYAFGARDYASVRRYVRNGLVLATFLSIALAVSASLLCGNIVRWINVPDDVIEEAKTYLSIILLGIPCTFFYNLLANIIRALGDSRTPFFFLIFSTFLNIALDICFIVVFRAGVAGAGIATVISQGLSAVLCYIYMRRHYDILREGSTSDCGRVKFSTVLKILGIGAPMGLQFSITAIGSIMIQSANNSLGTEFVAAFAAGLRIKMLFMCPLESLGMAMTTFAGQNYGAGKLYRVKEGVRAALLIDAVYSVLCLLAVWPSSPPLSRIFIDASEPAIIRASVMYIRCAIIAYFLLGSLCIFRYTIQGLGYTKLAMGSGIMEMIARVLVAFLVVPRLGFTGICINDILAWVAANVFLVPAYIFVSRRLNK